MEEPRRRRQITLFVPQPACERIEAVRQRFNPIQYGLIAAHVTLCRDDEVTDWEMLHDRASELTEFELCLEFGAPSRDGNFVSLSAVENAEFHQLRRWLLRNDNCRLSEPHITLIHPRNGTCSHQEYETICRMVGAITIRFPTLTFIEKNGNSPWNRLVDFPA